MKLHLPVRLFKSVLACLAAVASFSHGSGVAWADAQNLTFSGSSLIWDTSAENKSFVDEEDAAASFAAGDNVSFTGESTVTLGENITAGTLDIAAGADVTIDLGNYTLNADAISLSGTLNVGDSLSIASGSTLAVQNDTAVLDSALVLGENSGLVVESAASLNNNTLTLQGGSNLILTAAGDGKTYTLFTGVSGLVDAEGNAITLDSTNNAIANYFDTTRPGTGFWAGATLVLNDGALQLVRHNETVKDAVTITTRQTNGADYQYYAGVSFENIEYAAVDSNACGGAIYGVSSAITLSNNGSVEFIGNASARTGGAIYGRTITLSNNGSVVFEGNTGSLGGAISGGDIVLSNNGSVQFSGNTASYIVGAIHACGSLHIRNNDSVEFAGNVKKEGSAYRLHCVYVVGGDGGEILNISAAAGRLVAFYDSVYVGSGTTVNLNADYTDAEGNTIKQQGDILFTGATTVDDLYEVKGNVAGTEEEIRLSRTTEVNALTNLYGGRLRVEDGVIYQGQGIMVHEGSGATVRVKDATLSHSGYDLTFNSGTTLEVEGNCTITGNVKLQNGSNLVLSGSGAEIVGNASSSFLYAAGAAVSSSLSLQDYGSVTFTGNSENSESSRVDGGAVDGRSISLKNNGNVLFSGNVLNTDSSAFAEGAFGGAIKGGEILLAENESVIFIGNQANSAGYSSGGALDTDTGIQISNNGDVQFVENASSGVHNVFGGAIYVFSGTTLLSGNASVCFRGNSSTSSSYAYGGAIGFEGNSLDFRDNGTLQFFENKVVSTGGSARGGAIYSEYNLNIQNNDLVEFYQNAEVNNGIYRLRSIYSSWGNVNLSSAEGKYILFRDSVYIGSSSTLNLNADYGTIKQQGDIIFTGATTVNDLYAVKGDVAGTEEEIRLSRTTEVKAMTNLYGGRLRVEDGAIYQGQGITVHEDSKATVRVKDAELSHVGYDLTFNDGTALEVAGESTIRGLVNLQEGSVFKLEQGATLNLYETNGVALSVGGLAWLEGASTLNADLTLAEGSTLDIVSLDAGAVALNGVLSFGGQVTLGENLLALLDEKLGHESSITLFTGLENVDWATVTGNAVSDCVWAGAVFSNMAGNHSCYLNYASDTGSLVMQIVPEPATATLSLLALAALAARRRRN